MKRAYICDYCYRIFSSKDIRKHERDCSFNPKNRTCFTCAHCLTDYETNIKCRVKSQIAISIFDQDLLTAKCEMYEKGYPAKIIHI